MDPAGWSNPAVVLVCDYLVRFVIWMYHEFTHPRSERDETYTIDPDDFIH